MDDHHDDWRSDDYMSYEGHNQHICKAGHQFDADVYDEDDKCHCGQPSVWHNAVDDTNGDACGLIVDWSSLLTSPNTDEDYATYRIPSEQELKVLRTYYDYRSGLQLNAAELKVSKVMWE